MSHNMLTTLSNEGVEKEIIVNKIIIEEKIKQTISVFSYPNDLLANYDLSSVVITSNEDKQCAVFYITGSSAINKLGNQLFDLKRIHVDSDTTRSIFPLMLSFPDRLI